MSEEKIIEILNKLISWKGMKVEIRDYEIEAIQGLLDLYNKQKEEIEEWQKAYIKENNYWLKFRNKINKIANNDKDCSDNAVIKAVKDLKDKNTSLQKEIKLMKSININDNYVSKDKIREAIKDLEKYQKQHKEGNWADIPIEDYDFDKINLLKELLEE